MCCAGQANLYIYIYRIIYRYIYIYKGKMRQKRSYVEGTAEEMCNWRVGL